MSTADNTALNAAAADAIAAIPAQVQPEILVGFDGFVDNIIHVVDKRSGPDAFTRIPTIAEYGRRVSAAAGHSANFELVITRSKIGGNGPIMANALAAQGAKVTVVGLLGEGAVDPVFAPLAARSEIRSLGAPAVTDALEFDDGKLMLGKLGPLAGVTYDRLVAALGGVDGLKAVLRRVHGVASVNWTMTMGMTAIWERLAADILPGLRSDRLLWFIDLADPAKRTEGDIRAALEAMGRLQRSVDVVLGLNEAECRQIAGVLGVPWGSAAQEWEAARTCVEGIRRALGISRVMCHLVRSSAVAWDGGSAASDGFFDPKPKITTGAGDHYNAGFFGALLAGVAPAHCLQAGAATSGHYVRTAASPTRAELAAFLRGR